MSFVNTGNGFIERLIYDLRYEYTGYINIANLTSFVNDVLMEYYYTSVNNMPSGILSVTFPKLRVVTNNITTSNGDKLKPIKSENKYGDQSDTYSRLFPIPKFTFDNLAGASDPTTIDGDDYPNIARLENVYVIDDDLVPQENSVTGTGASIINLDFASETVHIISSKALAIAKKRHYRKPSVNRVYGVIHHQQTGYSVLEVTTSLNYIILEYFRYPTPLVYVTGEDPTEVVSELSEGQLMTLKEMAKVKFLERINDQRFKNYIQKKG